MFYDVLFLEILIFYEPQFYEIYVYGIFIEVLKVLLIDLFWVHLDILTNTFPCKSFGPLLD